MLLYFINIFSAGLECDFEDFSSCSWYNDADNADQNWKINAGSTPSSDTGPDGDYPSGKSELRVHENLYSIDFPSQMWK